MLSLSGDVELKLLYLRQASHFARDNLSDVVGACWTTIHSARFRSPELRDACNIMAIVCELHVLMCQQEPVTPMGD